MADVLPFSPALAAKLAQGETPRGHLLNAITAIELIRDELNDALQAETGRREAIVSAQDHLAGVNVALSRLADQMERGR